MADITIVPPGSTQNPWTPPGAVLLLGGTLQATTTQFKDASFTTTAVAHDVNYGPTITSAITLGATLSTGDDIFLGAVV